MKEKKKDVIDDKDKAKDNLTLYLPHDLKKNLQADAKKNFRSANSHAVWILTEHLKGKT